MARAAGDDSGKVLWLTLALSWVRLAEHVSRAGNPELTADGAGDLGAARLLD
jgi:hypothetical protein